jgi:hypothetical protein
MSNIENIDVPRMARDMKISKAEIETAFLHSSEEIDRQVSVRFVGRQYCDDIFKFEEMQLELEELERMAALRFLARKHFQKKIRLPGVL